MRLLSAGFLQHHSSVGCVDPWYCWAFWHTSVYLAIAYSAYSLLEDIPGYVNIKPVSCIVHLWYRESWLACLQIPYTGVHCRSQATFPSVPVFTLHCSLQNWGLIKWDRVVFFFLQNSTSEWPALVAAADYKKKRSTVAIFSSFLNVLLILLF